MGCNYYVRTLPSCGGKCEQHCRGEEIHLGKSSAGWTFTFRAYPDPDPDPGNTPEAVTWPVDDYASWQRLLTLGAIFDEYGREWTPEELLAKIDSKRAGERHVPDSYGFHDDAGNDFIAGEFS